MNRIRVAVEDRYTPIRRYGKSIETVWLLSESNWFTKFLVKCGWLKFNSKTEVIDTSYNVIDVNLDDVVKATMDLMFDYLARTGERPVHIFMGVKQFSDLKMNVDFQMPQEYIANVYSSEYFHAPYMWRGVQVHLVPRMDGVLVVGDV